VKPFFDMSVFAPLLGDCAPVPSSSTAEWLSHADRAN
jgi:hypothetical protein